MCNYVQLPVKTTLRQNAQVWQAVRGECNYQSKRRCAKTLMCRHTPASSCNYQSKRRCAKTLVIRSRSW